MTKGISMREFIFVLLVCNSLLLQAATDTCKVTIDLRTVTDDKVKVIVIPPALNEGIAEYIMPAVIPGSYSKKDFGRFISEFTAYDKKGKKLKMSKEGPNVFKIKKGEQISRIEYWVDDTWDATNEQFIFQPGGTNIQENRNFVINHQGFYGYFEGKKMNPYTITIHHPDQLYAHSALNVNRGKQRDDVTEKNYVKLVDNPIMYSLADTCSFRVSNMQVSIGVYSDNGVVNAAQVKKAVQPLAEALKNFFGKLPVDHYNFIMYFPRYGKMGVSRYGGFGALEHSYCSFYFLPEIQDQLQLEDMIQSIAGHEFLHILTPLNIHSFEIENFDFRNPKMSMHLWMYEGVTEYFAQLVRVKNNLIDEKGFQNEMLSKVINMNKYPSVSFTEMSKNILQPEFKEMYSNVYEKGALFGLLLDIRLHDLSKGTMGLRELMLMLAEKFGANKPFNDEQLIPEIVQMTYPEIKSFFTDFIIGNNPLPLKNDLGKLGWELYIDEEVEEWSLGKIHLFSDKRNGQVIVLETDSTKNKLGLHKNDIIQKIDTLEVKPGMDQYFDLVEAPSSGKPVTVSILRNGKEITLSASPLRVKNKYKFLLRTSESLSEEQIKFRNSFFGR